MASAAAAVHAWEAVIKHLQALGSDDLPVLHGLTPGVVTSEGAVAALETAGLGFRALPQGNQALCSQLLAHKVTCLHEFTQTQA